MRNGKSTAQSGSRPGSVTDPTAEPARAPLSVATDLTVEINGATGTVDSTGERLLVQFRSVPDGIRAARGLPEGSATGLPDLLAVTDLTLEVRIRDRIVTQVGAEARPGWISRSLDVDPFEIRIGGVLGAVGAELSAWVGMAVRLID